MPLFDYECQDCHHQFSELRKIAEKDAPIACPSCNKEETKRLVSAFAFGGGGSKGGGSFTSSVGSSGGSGFG